MSDFANFLDVIALWDSDAEFARDIGIKPSHAQVMKLRRSIPLEHWPNVISAAKRRRYGGVTMEALTELGLKLAAQRRRERPPKPRARPRERQRASA